MCPLPSILQRDAASTHDAHGQSRNVKLRNPRFRRFSPITGRPASASARHNRISKSCRWAIAPPDQEGWREAPGWLFRRSFLNNHPICADLEAALHFFDRAAAPPGQEGQLPTCKRLAIPTGESLIRSLARGTSYSFRCAFKRFDFQIGGGILHRGSGKRLL